MIRTGKQYLDSIRDGREVYINGERVKDVTRNPMLKPLIDIRARIYDMQHAAASREFLSYQDAGEWNAIANKLRALRAGAERGGEAGPVHSAGLLVVREVSWPIVDLRVA